MEENVRKTIVPCGYGYLRKDVTPQKHNHGVKKDLITSKLRISGKSRTLKHVTDWRRR